MDPAGGSGGDSFTLAVAHCDAVSGKAILDVVREIWPPFNPEEAVEDLSALLSRYRVRVVTGDRYAGDWVASAFRRRGIAYRPAEKTRSQIYTDLLPLMNSGGVELLDDARLIRQLVGLERRAGSSGRDIVDHPPAAHDDVINAAAGALLLAAAAGGSLRASTVFQADAIRVGQ